VGHYTITHSGALPALPAITCPGDLDITTQTGSSFSGTITIVAIDPCPPGFAGSGTIQGTVTGSTISFSITLSTLEQALIAFGCTIIGGDPMFTGSAGATGISAGRTIRLRCEAVDGPFEVDFEYTISGPKT
jgi:hypothetical protein